jgi:hypothetical protein
MSLASGDASRPVNPVHPDLSQTMGARPQKPEDCRDLGGGVRGEGDVAVGDHRGEDRGGDRDLADLFAVDVGILGILEGDDGGIVHACGGVDGVRRAVVVGRAGDDDTRAREGDRARASRRDSGAHKFIREGDGRASAEGAPLAGGRRHAGGRRTHHGRHGGH